ncbi:hypothetical protein RSAG8_11779, partial [Rhizoctonia solani AG-8 WAC10335]
MSTLRKGQDEYLFPRDSSHQALLESIMPMIRTLQLNKIDIYFGSISFHKLVEIQIKCVILGYKSDLHQLLYVLSSSSELQIIKLINMIVLPSPINSNGENDWIMSTLRSSHTLPKLEVLHLQGLYFNVIQLVFGTGYP